MAGRKNRGGGEDVAGRARGRWVWAVVLALLAGVGTMGGWWIFERVYAGAGYRWTTWEEIAFHETVAEGVTPPVSAGARGLEGRRVMMIAQRCEVPERTPMLLETPPFIDMLHMPYRLDFLDGAPYVHVRPEDAAKLGGWEEWGVIRVWGRLHVLEAPIPHLLAPCTLEMDVDRADAIPAFLPDALAPMTPWGWTFWAVIPAVAAGMAGWVMRMGRRLLNVRWIGISVAVMALLAATGVAGAWIFVPNQIGVLVTGGAYGTEISVGRLGLVVHLQSDYSYYDKFGLARGSWSYNTALGPGPMLPGLGVDSGYWRYDWGNVHAVVFARAAAGWVIGGLVLAALGACWCARKGKLGPGLCPKCGYDLRAHQAGERCPECGRVIGEG